MQPEQAAAVLPQVANAGIGAKHHQRSMPEERLHRWPGQVELGGVDRFRRVDRDCLLQLHGDTLSCPDNTGGDPCPMHKIAATIRVKAGTRFRKPPASQPRRQARKQQIDAAALFAMVEGRILPRNPRRQHEHGFAKGQIEEPRRVRG